MYRKLNNNATPRETAEVVNRILDGGINSTGTIALNNGDTKLTNLRIGYDSVILLSPRTAELSSSPYVKIKAKGEAIISFSGDTGAKYDYVILG
jgi:autotransporter translocation and assembly factor TamB